MSDAYQFANILTVAVLSGAFGLIAGHGWGRESQQQAEAKAAVIAEAARVDSFRVIFAEGVAQPPKKEEALQGQSQKLLSQRSL